MDNKEIIKIYKKKPLFSINNENTEKVNYGINDIFKILPNREPFIFIDKITEINLSEGFITGTRHIDKNDPVFKGHFPDNPVYPGVLLLEMISEIFCSLFYFLKNNTVQISAPKVHLRATRMNDALLQYGIFPGDDILITAKQIENNGLTFTGVGQIVKDNKVCVLTLGEYYIIE